MPTTTAPAPGVDQPSSPSPGSAPTIVAEHTEVLAWRIAVARADRTLSARHPGLGATLSMGSRGPAARLRPPGDACRHPDGRRRSSRLRWRSVNAPRLVTLARAGARFERGQLAERPYESGGDQQTAVTKAALRPSDASPRACLLDLLVRLIGCVCPVADH